MQGGFNKQKAITVTYQFCKIKNKNHIPTSIIAEKVFETIQHRFKMKNSEQSINRESYFNLPNILLAAHLMFKE